MRIVIDLQGAQTESRSRGIGRYSLALAKAVARWRGEHEVIVALNGAFPDSIDPIRAEFQGLLPRENVRIWTAPQAGPWLYETDSRPRLQAEVLREAFLADQEPDWLLVTSLFEGLADDGVTSIGCHADLPTAVVLYDLVPWIYPDSYLADEDIRAWYLTKLDHLRRADRLLAISESSGQEAIEYLGMDSSDVANISTGADERFTVLDIDASTRQRLVRSYGVNGSFIMYTAVAEPRKNVERLVEAFARLPAELRQVYQLVLVGKMRDEQHRELVRHARAAGLSSDEVVVTGFAPDDDLLLLYNACALFVFPSWHEGFGLPALEAMQCGRPVLASNRSSLPEVVGLSEALFDPYDVADMASKMERALTDELFRKRLSAHGLSQVQRFSWDRTAQRTWATLEAAQAEKPMPVDGGELPVRRPRLAYVSPLPPERSGIADYSAELLRELTRWYQVDVVLKEPAGLTDDSVRAGCGVLSVPEFCAQAGRYARVLYHFGNSDFHDHMFGLLEEIPGTVVLHDFFLSGLQAYDEVRGHRPLAYSRVLLSEQGYGAVAEWYRGANRNAMTVRYPGNLAVLQDALGIIVHSEYSRELAARWYGGSAGRDWAVIPLLRAAPHRLSRADARSRLGLDPEACVICSFGLLEPAKLNDRLLEAWLASPFAQRTDVHLVFVGKAQEGQYGDALQRLIRGNARITVTGWVDGDVYRAWLAAADIAVQLRSDSRGETSAAVLDCMNYGLATVANAHGSMAQLDAEAVWLLRDEFAEQELISALQTLVDEPGRRQALGERAQRAIHERHNPRRVAEQYARAIEAFHVRASRGLWGAIRSVAAQSPDWGPQVAACLSRNHPPQPRRRQWLVDVSPIVRHDLKTGIQRVVRAVLLEWLQRAPEGYQVEPVYASPAGEGYRYARRFSLNLLDVPGEWAEDEPVEAWAGDVFIMLDMDVGGTPVIAPVWREWQRRGVVVGSLLYDLLPLQRSEWFPEGISVFHDDWLRTIVEGDLVIAISAAVARELRDWLRQHAPERLETLRIEWFHLGADIHRSAPSRGLPKDANRVLARLRAAPSFLMVGTVEPRKSHAETLAAFEKLWSQGVDVNLVIVGKQGWMVEGLAKRLRSHPESGYRLHWLKGISDEYLEQLYAASTCLIAASLGEGFGLPLIEAAQHGLPIIARDIPVFREVAGDHAYYVSGEIAEEFAQSIQTWISLYDADRHPKSEGMSWLTWRESAAMLSQKILGESVTQSTDFDQRKMEST